YGQPTGAFEYTKKSYQSQEPIFDYTRAQQQSTQSSFNLETPAAAFQQTEPKQTIDHLSQALTSSTSYEELRQPGVISQAEVGYGQPTGTVEYTRKSYQSQEPIFDDRRAQQRSTQYSYNLETPGADLQQTERKQTMDHLSQTDTSSTYYEELRKPRVITQAERGYGQPTGAFEYTKKSYQSQEPIFDYTRAQQQSTQSSFNLETPA
ncbi:unnamed protein product, partial [Rotaria sp. Silwood2]